MGQNEFAQCGIQGVSVDTRPCGEDEIGRGAVPDVLLSGRLSVSLRGYLHGVASSDHFTTRPKYVFERTRRAWSLRYVGSSILDERRGRARTTA